MDLTYNLYHLRLSSGNMFIYNPGNILCINALESSRLNIMVFTREFVDEIGLKIENVPLLYQTIKYRQIFSLTDSSCDGIRLLMETAENLLAMDKTGPYYGEMLNSLFKSFIYRALHEIGTQYHDEATELLPASENSNFDKFMRLLEENYVRHHSIRFYSGKMGLTPKYLSLMIKKVSGKLATQWIDEYVILEAKNLIKYSSMSIQEVAYALNFPNQSFFGKYFKRHTGLSPKEYRIKS
ncbi:MAG: helix-turn-helix domain-containing protein [Paenibacillus sp.]|nr:helix-turn-helix domain-containing protein [Paenibacillus sp.]